MRNRAEAREFRGREQQDRPELTEKEQQLFDKLVAYCDEIREKELDWQKRIVYALEKYKADGHLEGAKRAKFYRLLMAEHGRRGREQQKAGRPAERTTSRRQVTETHSSGSFTDEQVRRMIADARRREVEEQIRSGEIDPPDDRPTRLRREHPDHP